MISTGVNQPIIFKEPKIDHFKVPMGPVDEPATYKGRIRQTFFFMEDVGFRQPEIELDWPESTNFRALYRGDDLQVLISRKQGRALVQLSDDGEHWQNKETLLQELGISKDRHPKTDLGHWTGYRLTTQAEDLRQHLDLLLSCFLNR